MILDFNNFAMRSLHTCQFMEPDVKIKNFDTKKECDILIRKITIDICRVIRTFTPNRVIISCDSKQPWRKDLYKDIDGTRRRTASSCRCRPNTTRWRAWAS